MKLEKLDHKHALTSWLKVILFACLMLAPIMSVVVRSLYVVCNKNAKDSYYGETINEQTNTNVKFNEMVINSLYNISGHPLDQYVSNLNVSNASIYVEDVKGTLNNNEITDNISRLGFYAPENSYNLSLYIYDENNNYISSSTNFNVEFIYKGVRDNTNNVLNTVFDNQNYFYTISYNSNSYLDNVFDYSISQIEESQFYNWTQNTAIYNGVEAMTTGLGITGATVPILITYWFLLTVIYIVIDIVINLFTYLTHFLNKKTN